MDETYLSPEPQRQQSDSWFQKLKKILGILFFPVLLVIKFGGVLLKFKGIGTLISMVISVGAYTLFWGLPFAIGFVLLILIHEMGHVIQLRREGIKASAPMFIPFLGAVIAAKELGKDVAGEARVGLAGPILGTIGTLIPVGVYFITGDPFFKALAYVGFLINFFNLIPVLPLDGGRAMAAVSTKLWFVGLVAIIAYGIIFKSILALLIVIFGGFELMSRYKNRNSPESQAYHQISTRARVMVFVVYIVLAIALAAGMHAAHIPNEELDRISS